ncbi:MAG: roadblock/LC7 domain-containing protein [Thermoplasmata archaeon]
MSAEAVLSALKGLESIPEVELCMLLRKNGDIVLSAGNVGSLSLETFGIMTATIYGAANTANEHLNKSKPNRIVIRSNDGDTLIKDVDSKYVLVIRTATRKNFPKVLTYMDKTIENIPSDWEV